MHALIDIDDVILDWTAGFDIWARKYKGYVGPPIQLRPDHIGTLFYPEIYDEFNSSENFKSLEIIEGAQEALQKIAEIYKIVLISSCGIKHLESREINLKAQLSNISFSLILLNIHENKDKYIDFYKPDLYIDDNMNNVKYSAEQDCVNTYIFHTEFNKLFNHPKVKRAYTWQQILKEI